MTATVHRTLAARVSWIRIRCAVAAGKLGSDFNQIQAPQRDCRAIGGKAAMVSSEAGSTDWNSWPKLEVNRTGFVGEI
jgi:hypothetical protein